MQYRLIEHPKEKGEFIAISDDKIEESLFVFNVSQKTIFIADRQLVELINDPNISLTTNKKIVASSIFIHPSIPLIRKEQLNFHIDSFDIAEEALLTEGEDYRDICSPSDYVYAFSRGYNKHAETYKYTEEDLRKAFEGGRNKYAAGNIRDAFDSFLQSLKQPKEYIVEFEIETTFKRNIGYMRRTTNIDSKLKLYKEGEHNYVNIISIKPI